MKFENPSNGYSEEVSSLVWLWVLLFGAFYFAVKGVWTHAILGLVLAIITGGISWLIYPFFASGIMRKNYLNKGWKEVYTGTSKQIKLCPHCGGKNRSQDVTCIHCSRPC